MLTILTLPQPNHAVSKHLVRRSFALVSISVAMVSLVASLGLEAEAQASSSPSYVNIQADEQTYEPATGKSKFTGHVRVKYQDFSLSSPKADIQQNAQGYVANFYPKSTAKRTRPNVGEDILNADKISIFMDTNRLWAEGNAVTQVTTIASNTITIHSNTQEINNNTNTMTASGNVKVNYKDMVITGPQAKMQMGASGKAERAIFSGGVNIVDGKGTLSGSKVTMMVGSGNITAEGRVVSKVKSSGTKPIQLRSNYQQFDKNSDTVLASGAVKIDYEDYVATGPKATIRMNNGNVNKVFLTGRSTIVDSARRVTADKITITTNPKHFDAIGNVKTKFTTKPTATAKPAPTKGGTTQSANATPAPPAGPQFEDF